jgi:peroxiredoxin
MRLFASFSVVFFGALFTANAYSQSVVQINGQLEDVPSESVILAYYLGNKQYVLDTALTDAKGKFVFAYPKLLERGVYLFYFPNRENRYVEFLVSSDQQFSVKGKLSDFTKTATFSGSTDNTLFYGHLKQLETFRKKEEKWLAVKERHGVDGNIDSTKMADDAILQNANAYQAYQKEFLVKNPNSFLEKLMRFSQRPEIPQTITDRAEQFYYYKNHFFDNLDWSFQGVMRSKYYAQLLTEYIDNLTVQDPDSISAGCDVMLQKTKGNDELFKYTLIELLNKYARSSTICFDAIYVHLIETYYLKGQAFWLNPAVEKDKVELKKLEDAAARLKPVLCGSYAYNFNLADASGAKHELRKVAGERTILVFWSSDCHKCEAFMKELATISDLCTKKGVSIVSVDNGNDPKLWRQKLEKYPVNNIIALTSSSSEELSVLIEQYDLYSTPVAFLLDKDKKILYKKLEVDQIKEIIERLPNVSH